MIDAIYRPKEKKSKEKVIEDFLLYKRGEGIEKFGIIPNV
jgi:hypothetical protein